MVLAYVNGMPMMPRLLQNVKKCRLLNRGVSRSDQLLCLARFGILLSVGLPSGRVCFYDGMRCVFHWKTLFILNHRAIIPTFTEYGDTSLVSTTRLSSIGCSLASRLPKYR